MLSDEEKAVLKTAKENYGLTSAEQKILVNLIEKQSKEIEGLKQKEKEAYNFGYRNGCNDTSKFNDKTFIRIDKIKEILGIEEETDTEKILSLLQTIVDENARLEDIEDRKVQIEYNNVFNKGVKSVEDKIKAKIKELEKQDRENRISHNYLVIPILQSLLEKE